MLLPRIIPCLLIHNKGLVKTQNFKHSKYVGDPINAVKIFNEKQVDELMVLDIDATINQCEPDYKLIEQLASECRMPLCYGGGIKTVSQAKTILSLGVEKVSLSSSIIERPELITEIAAEVGAQSVVVVLDLKKKRLSGAYELYTHNGKKKHKIELLKFIQQLGSLGAGELVINSIDNDGQMKGYDLHLINKIKPLINIPLTVLGGAGSLKDLIKVISLHHLIGAAAGSLFVFKGKYRAVLINYPSEIEKNQMFHEAIDLF